MILPTMENKAQLVSMLFDITLRLKNQMDHNRTTTTTLLAKAHTLKDQIAAQHGKSDYPESADTSTRALSELQHENEDLKASVREYKQTIEVIIEKHLMQMTELHQEHLAREKRLEDQLASEKHRAQALRTQNVYLKEKVEQMLQVMKAACASDKDHAYDEEVYMAALESENKTLRTALGLDTM